MWVLALLPVLIALGLLWRVRLPTSVRLVLTERELEVRLGRDAVYCLRRELRVPRSGVAGVAAVPAADVPRRGLRLPGTAFPGWIRAGSYGTGAERTFWDVRRADRYLVVELLPGGDYKRLVLEVADPDAEARRLAELGTVTGGLP